MVYIRVYYNYNQQNVSQCDVMEFQTLRSYFLNKAFPKDDIGGGLMFSDVALAQAFLASAHRKMYGPLQRSNDVPHGTSHHNAVRRMQVKK